MSTVKFEFPWLEEPFVQQNFNVYDMIDEKVEKLKCVFPKARVLNKYQHPREFLAGQNAYYNRVDVEVELGEPNVDYLNRGTT